MLVASVAGELKSTNVWVCLSAFFDQLPGSVAAAVINKDDRTTLTDALGFDQIVDDGKQAADGFREDFLFIVAGHHDGDDGAFAVHRRR